MAVFISVTTSPFEDVFNEAAESRAVQNVRRPTRGVELKKDTYATIKVIDGMSNPIPFVDSSAPPAAEGGTIGQSLEYSNFILQGVQEQRVEKQQIVETFGEDYIYFFGERPRVYNFSALILNTRNFNWKNEWWTNYENVLRGTRLLERNARMYIYYDDIVLEGYMLMAQAAEAVDDPYRLPLTFQVFCTNYSVIGDVGSIFTPRDRPRSSASEPGLGAAPDDQNIVAADAVSKVQQDSLTGFLADAAKFANDASFTVQRALEQAKNTLYGRSLAFPNTGIGNQISLPPIDNRAQFQAARSSEPTPIYMQKDEYTAYVETSSSPVFDEAELKRVKEELRLRSPAELERSARGHLASVGVQIGRPSAEYLLLGRAAFAGLQTFGSFGIRQADGQLNLAGGALELGDGVASLFGG